jgi:hypothetical protein
VSQHAPKGAQSFFFCGGLRGVVGGGDAFLEFLLFQSISQWVSNMFPISTSLCSIRFAQHCPLGTYKTGPILKPIHLFLAQNQKPTWPLSSPSSKQKKTLGTPWVHAEPSRWLHDILISKTVCHHLSPGLMEKAKACGGRVRAYHYTLHFIISKDTSSVLCLQRLISYFLPPPSICICILISCNH